MTTFTSQAHDPEFREHVVPPVSSSSSEPMAMDHPINGNASQNNSIHHEFPQPHLQAPETSNDDLASSKLHQRSPSPRVEMSAMETAPQIPSQPFQEPAMTVTSLSETTTAVPEPLTDRPVMSATVATASAKTPDHEIHHAQATVSPETKMQMDEPLGLANDVGQAVTSDERNAPLEEEMHAMTEVPPAIPQAPEHEQSTILASQDSDHQSIFPIPSQEPPASDIPAPEVPEISKPETALAPTVTSVDQKMEDVVPTSSKIAREREEDDEAEPEAKRPKTETEPEARIIPEGGQTEINAPVSDTPVIEAPALEVPTSETPVVEAPAIEAPVPSAEPSTESAIQDVSMTTAGEPTSTNEGLAVAPAVPVDPAAAVAAAAAEGAAAADAALAASAEAWGPITDAQTRQLKQALANLKKGRHAASFAKPVDAMALKIPQYYDVITNPMDLGTMEQKLKEGKYESVKDFVTDFNLIIDNCVKFNGPTHVVSLAGMNMKAQFSAAMKKVPKAGEVVPPAQKKQRKSSFALPAREPKHRESRASLGSATSPTSNAANQTFALGQHGVPLTRRTSNQDGRPKREIHRPPPRDLPYLSAKPKKKKFQLELKFCEEVLGELKRGRYADYMQYFAAPVNPVTLNIPDYHKYVKTPMDFRTITEKLQSGQYENAKEFHTDVKLVFNNCYKFNGPAHPVSQAGKALENVFDEFWATKQKWLSSNAPPSAPQSPEVDSESEEEEEEEEEEDEEEDERAAQIASLQEKIAELSAQAVALTSAPPPKKAAKIGKKKPEKAKKGAPSKMSRKSGSLSGPASAKKQEKKAKPKTKAKPVTMKDKAEIAERIGELSVEDTSKAAEYIKKGLQKIGSPLADRPDEELEFDIDQIPDETLSLLLKLVRKNDPPAKESRPSLSATKASSASRPKKNKPMGKHEQEDAIRRLTSQIETFHNPDGAGGSENTTGQDALSSDDDDSGSESEEE